MYGIKYTKERLEELGIDIIIPIDENTWKPSVIVEGNDGSFMRYPPVTMTELYDSNIVDDAVDLFIIQLRKEKLKKLNEVQA
jgi:hypothetical protein